MVKAEKCFLDMPVKYRIFKYVRVYAFYTSHTNNTPRNENNCIVRLCVGLCLFAPFILSYCRYPFPCYLSHAHRLSYYFVLSILEVTFKHSTAVSKISFR